jgi:fructose-1,6-bisphosphatase I
MSSYISLDDHLASWAKDDAARQAVAATVTALAGTCREIADIVAAGPLAGQLGKMQAAGSGGDFQTELDIRANTLLVDALRAAPVTAVASEELDVPVALTPDAPLVVALDPLDGSSNIDTNVSIGTIFSLLPTPPNGGAEPAAFLQPGCEQVAAGYVLYGPQTALALTVGAGTDIFTLDRARGVFLRTKPHVQVPPISNEFAINASNARHWSNEVRQWFDDCIAGAEGPRGRNFNMRWIASMVAEAHRILTRGGVYIYPGDAREGYHSGRLRLVYEGNPIAFLMEQAGAAASTGRERILERIPRMLHERVPLIFGSREEVEWLERHHIEPHLVGEQSPLFGRRGLFRA